MPSIDRLHPSMLFAYFITVTLLPMFLLDPVILTLSLAGAVSCLCFIKANKRFGKVYIWLLMLAGITLINPLFSHSGATALFFLNGKPVTLEALVYGLVSALMIIGVVLWFRAFSLVMTSEKLLYVIGGFAPKASLILTAALRYIPLFGAQAEKTRKAQTAMGLYSRDNSVDRVRSAARVFSVITTWSFENAIDTADSMRARGYGTGRTLPFTLYRYRTSDVIFAAVNTALIAAALTGAIIGNPGMTFYPELALPDVSVGIIVCYAAYGILALLPAIAEIKEIIKWKYLMSKI